MAFAGANLAERMQFRGTRLTEETIPSFGAKPDDAGEPSLQVAKFHGARKLGEVPAKRAHDAPILRTGIQGCDQENRSTSQRRGYRLCEGRRPARVFRRDFLTGIH